MIDRGGVNSAKWVYVTDGGIADLEATITQIEKETAGTTYGGKMPEMLVLVKGMIKELRRLQTRVEWLERKDAPFGSHQLYTQEVKNDD